MRHVKYSLDIIYYYYYYYYYYIVLILLWPVLVAARSKT